MLAFGFILPFLPLYLKEIGVTPESAVVFWSGALVTSTGVSLAIFSPIWGALADRRGRKLMVLRSMLIGGVILALMGLVTNVGQLLVLRILQGMFTGTIAASTALVATIVPRERLGSSMGLLQTSVYVGISAGPVVGGALAQAVGIRGTFFLAGAMLVAGGILVWQFVHEHFAPPSTSRRPGFFVTLRLGLASRSLMPLMVTLLLVQLSSAIVFPILPLFVERLSAASDPVKLYAGLAFGATAVFSALAAISYSRLVVRSGYRQILVLACFGAAAFFLPQAFAQNVWQFLLLRAALGIFFGVLIPATNAIVGLITPPDLRGSAYGLTSSATAVGNAVGPLLGSTLAASFGYPSVFIATAAVLALLGVWVTALVREPGPLNSS
ncbi:MAG: multidrug efflux MFS transporter [Chloroflexi bacterium]|nr:MAG: multidrug efflux MFS transporter [Chloroflexota bacterium]